MISSLFIGKKMSARKWIVISGLSWLVIGSYLMFKGLKWITLAMALPETPGLLRWFVSLAGSLQQGALLLICLGLLIGFIKGRMVLSKSVNRIVKHLRELKEPIQFSNAYDKKYYIILGSMMGLGLLFRFLPIPFDIRGAIDVTIGSALINGAMLYFREAIVKKYSKV
jgi:hypothetical protein